LAKKPAIIQPSNKILQRTDSSTNIRTAESFGKKGDYDQNCLWEINTD
jgi:hypothetical protein